MNGTTNFILDAMISEARDFDDVLSEAQRLGYAEADPSADIDGLDTARKTAISSSIAFDTQVDEKGVLVFSLRNIKKCDIEYIGKKLNSTVRYVGTGALNGDVVSAYVEPTILESDSILANVKKNNNMISLVGKNVGQLSFFGQGAGKYPTGISVAQDVIDVVNGDTDLLSPGKKLAVDNSSVVHSYYVRTKAAFPAEYTENCEKLGQDNYIITKPVSVLEMHKIADEISSKDGEFFCAGIKR